MQPAGLHQTTPGLIGRDAGNSTQIAHTPRPAVQPPSGDAASAFHAGANIKVIGVGGGGGNAVTHMIASGVKSVDFICANTDAQALRRTGSEKIIQLGLSGLGAGSRPEVGKDMALQAEADIRAQLQGTQMLFITAGLGGGTGTGAAPVIARIAREMGILTVGVVTKPFDFEGPRRNRAADLGLQELEPSVDSLIVVLNEKLLDVLGDDVSQEDAFAAANNVLLDAVGGITSIIQEEGLVNVDFEDVRTVMEQPGRAMMGTAYGSGPDRAFKAAEAAVACPLLEGINLSCATGLLVLVSAARKNFKLSETRNVMNIVRKYADENAHIIMGTSYNDELGDRIRVTVIATGLNAGKNEESRGKLGHSAAQTIQPSPTQLLAEQRLNGSEIPLGIRVRSGATSPLQPTQGLPSRVGHHGAKIIDTNPNVWRTRSYAAEKVGAMSASGMEEMEIPAFLRKQAD